MHSGTDRERVGNGVLLAVSDPVGGGRLLRSAGSHSRQLRARRRTDGPDSDCRTGIRSRVEPFARDRQLEQETGGPLAGHVLCAAAAADALRVDVREQTATVALPVCEPASDPGCPPRICLSPLQGAGHPALDQSLVGAGRSAQLGVLRLTFSFSVTFLCLLLLNP